MHQSSAPVKYITIPPIIHCGDEGVATFSREKENHPPLYRQFNYVSQLSLIDLHDITNCESIYSSEQQPSLSRTYDLYDSVSIDQIDDKISLDALLIISEGMKMNNITIENTSDSSNTFDFIDDLISEDDLSIETEKYSTKNKTICESNDVSSFDIIDDMISSDGLCSVNTRSHTQSGFRVEALPVLSPTLQQIKKNLRSLEIKHASSTIVSIKQCKFHAIQDIRNRRRNFEAENEVRKQESRRKRIHQQYVDTVQLNAEVVLNQTPMYKKICPLECRVMREIPRMKKDIIQSAVEIACMNIVIGLAYFIFILYRSSIEIIIKKQIEMM